MLPPDQPKYLPPKKVSDTTHDNTYPPPANSPGEYGDPGQAPAAQPVALSSAPSLTTLMHAFRRSWKVAVPVAVLGALAAAAAAWILVPPQYTVSVVFRILSRPGTGSSEEEGMFVHVQKAQVALLKSFDVLNESVEKSRAAELYGVNYSPAKLAKQLVTGFNEGPEIMSVALATENPDAGVALLSALAEIYPTKVNQAEETRIKSQIAQLRKKLQLDQMGKEGAVPTLAEQLRDKRVELAAAEQKAGLDDSATTAAKFQAAQQALSSSRAALNKLKVDRVGLEAALAAKESRVAQPTPTIITDTDAEAELRTDPDYQDLMKRINAEREVIANIKRVMQPSRQGRELRGPRDRLAALEESRKDLIDVARRKLASRARSVQQELLKKDAQDLADAVSQSKKQEAELLAEIERHAKEVENYKLGGSKGPPEILALRDQVEQLEREYRRVGEQLAALDGSLPLQPRVTKHTDVFKPTEKEYNRPIKFALAGGAVAFALLLAGVCLMEARGRRVYASDDIMQGLGMRIVGTLPKLPAAARTRAAQSQMIGGMDSQFGMTEAIDALRTVLLHAPRVDGARVVMITSAAGGEGKTTLAGHLAASLARAWRKTLLIDGDLRNPMQHIQFEQTLEPGLCEALRAEVEFDDVIRPTLTSRLWVMPAGKLDSHALQALAQESVKGIFDRLKEQYDFIIVDTSPVLPVPEALLLGKQADVVLLALMKDHSRMPAVYQAQQRLESLGIRVLGGVMIGEKNESYGHAVPYPRSGS